MKGRFPTCVIMMEIPFGQVDVNVHPAKTEVKFARERDVFDLVYFGVKSALERGEKREIIPPSAPKIAPVDNVTEYQQRLDSTVKESKENFVGPKIVIEPDKKEPSPKPEFTKYERKQENERITFHSSELAEYKVTPKTEKKTVPQIEITDEEDDLIVLPQVQKEKTQKIEVKPEEKREEEKKSIPPIRYIGEAMNTYIIVECGDAVVFIDKHAAHERIIFEKLKKSCGDIQTQILLTPEIISLDAKAAAVLLENRDEISKLGFEIDDFGNGSVAVSAVPDGIDAHDALSVLDKLAETLKSGARPEQPEVISETMYSVACKAAIKAGQKNSPEELLAIAERVLLEDDIRYCPHGRPVMIEYTKYELEKKFKRIV